MFSLNNSEPLLSKYPSEDHDNHKVLMISANKILCILSKYFLVPNSEEENKFLHEQMSEPLLMCDIKTKKIVSNLLRVIKQRLILRLSPKPSS